MLSRSVPIALILLVTCSSHASSQSIGIFADLGSSSCNIDAPLFSVSGEPANLYVNVVGFNSGVAGVEFQVSHSIPHGIDGALWFIYPNPLADIVIGNPMEGGCNVAFVPCSPAGMSINLYRIELFVFDEAAAAEKTLSITAHSTPSDPSRSCPLVVLCNSPVFTTVCIAGGQAFVNDTTDCTVAIEDQTWTGVKSLFR